MAQKLVSVPPGKVESAFIEAWSSLVRGKSVFEVYVPPSLLKDELRKLGFTGLSDEEERRCYDALIRDLYSRNSDLIIHLLQGLGPGEYALHISFSPHNAAHKLIREGILRDSTKSRPKVNL